MRRKSLIALPSQLKERPKLAESRDARASPYARGCDRRSGSSARPSRSPVPSFRIIELKGRCSSCARRSRGRAPPARSTRWPVFNHRSMPRRFAEVAWTGAEAGLVVEAVIDEACAGLLALGDSGLQQVLPAIAESTRGTGARGWWAMSIPSAAPIARVGWICCDPILTRRCELTAEAAMHRNGVPCSKARARRRMNRRITVSPLIAIGDKSPEVHSVDGFFVAFLAKWSYFGLFPDPDRRRIGAFRRPKIFHSWLRAGSFTKLRAICG